MSEYTDMGPNTGLIQNCEVDGERVDIRFHNAILEIGDLTPGADEKMIDAEGNALFPGLHDHHIHMRALAAHRNSVCLAPGQVPDREAMRDLILAASGDGWLRCVDYHESSLGELRAPDLDFVARPVRVQHRSGKLWVLNSTALAQLRVHGVEGQGVERDGRGRPTGRLFRMDDWLARALRDQGDEVELDSVVNELLSYGITEITDASYTNRRADESALQADCHPLRVMCMGVDTQGAWKVMLDEDALPEFDALVADIRTQHGRDRGVAFHCVSRTELVFLLAALDAAGAHNDDRIEHGGVIPIELIAEIKRLGCAVVTQPGFVATKGDAYLKAVPQGEHQDLYRYETLRRAGISVLASSDAPYGPVNPWQVTAAAVARRTAAGKLLAGDERTSAEEALSGYLRAYPKGPVRGVTVGEAADFCLLDRDWAQAQADIASVNVLATWIGGEQVYRRER